MVGLQTVPLRNFAHSRFWPKRLGDNPRLLIIRPLTIAPPPAATCEKLQWSVHGETLALTSTDAGSHGRRKDGRWGEDTAYCHQQVDVRSSTQPSTITEGLVLTHGRLLLNRDCLVLFLSHLCTDGAADALCRQRHVARKPKWRSLPIGLRSFDQKTQLIDHADVRWSKFPKAPRAPYIGLAKLGFGPDCLNLRKSGLDYLLANMTTFVVLGSYPLARFHFPVQPLRHSWLALELFRSKHLAELDICR